MDKPLVCGGSGIRLRHAVADAYLGKEVFRLGGIFFDLAADIGHVDPELAVSHIGA